MAKVCQKACKEVVMPKPKKKKKVVELTSQERYNQAVTLMNSTNCIFKIEDKYDVYVKLTKRFLELKKLNETEPFDGVENCDEYSERCNELAQGLKQELPKEREVYDRTVTTTAKKAQTEEKKSKGKWYVLAVLVLLGLMVGAYFWTPTRYYIATIEDCVGLDGRAINLYKSISDYKDSDELAMILAYEKGLSYEADAKWKAARAMFKKGAVEGYKDSEVKMVNAQKQILKASKPADFVRYGKCEWQILDIKDGKALLAKRKSFVDKMYHDKSEMVTWSRCSLRKYLNDEFLKETFLTKEIENICDTSVKSVSNKKYGTSGGEATTDKIFILDEATVNEYDEILKNKKKNMRLREPGKEASTTTFFDINGEVVEYGFPVDSNGLYVCPCMWVSIE